MSELSHYEKTGYLHDDFKIFHLKDTSMRPIDFHYHDFHKILIFRKGNISYNVEGRTYDLIPGDIVFVPAGTVHRPVLHSSEIYERIIIYISRHYLDACHDSDDLSLCLKKRIRKNRMYCVFRHCRQHRLQELSTIWNNLWIPENTQTNFIINFFFWS